MNGPMSNLIEFSKDFNCPLGSPMNPIKKCKVWWPVIKIYDGDIDNCDYFRNEKFQKHFETMKQSYFNYGHKQADMI